MFIGSLIEEYVGKAFEIGCLEIEIHRKEDNQPPLFKGPGMVSGDVSGKLSFKLFNQNPITIDTYQFLSRVRGGERDESTFCRLFAKDYDGVSWNGGWFIPNVNTFKGNKVKNYIIRGQFSQLGTRIGKVKGDQDQDLTELIFAGGLALPFAGTVSEKKYHGRKVMSVRWRKDHHKLNFGRSKMVFQESDDKSRTHVKVAHTKDFTPPYVEQWLTEALIFVTARMTYPRMVIRHFQDDALVFIRETLENTESGMPPPFSRDPKLRECTWDVFRAYVAKCKETRSFDFLQITKGFSELILASRGTVQGFLISLALYIENCIGQIFSKKEENKEYSKQIGELVGHLDKWEGDPGIKKRARGLLSMLNSSDISKRMDTLIKQQVISQTHKKIWKKARPYLAHGGIIDFSKNEEFWDCRNYFISMAYRLTFRLLGYRGKVADYDGSEFRFIEFNWSTDS